MDKTITFTNASGIFFQLFQKTSSQIPGAVELVYLNDLSPDGTIVTPIPDSTDKSKIIFYFLPLAHPKGTIGRFIYAGENALPSICETYTYDPLTPVDNCKVTVIVTVTESATPATVRLENKSNLRLSLERMGPMKVFEEGKKDSFQKVAQIGPYETFTYSGFVGQHYVVRDMYSGMVVEWFWINTQDFSYQLLLKSRLNRTNGNEPVTIRFINCSTIKKGVYDIAPDGALTSDIPKINIGEVVEEKGYAGNIYYYPAHDASDIIPDNDAAHDQLFIAGTASVQDVFLIDKTKSIQVSFHNQMNLVLNAYMVINGVQYLFGKNAPSSTSTLPSLGEIAPHDTLSLYSEIGMEWVFTVKYGDEESGPVHRMTVSEAGVYNLNGNHLGQAITAESATRTVRLTNKSPFTISVQEKKTDESLGNILGTVDSADYKEFLEVKVGTALEAKDQYSGHRIAQIVVPHGVDTFFYDIQYKSWKSQHNSTLTIYNRTNIWLNAYWFDYDGKEQQIAEIAPGCIQKLKTFLTHPWVLKDQKSGRIVECLYANQAEELVEINSFSIIPKEGEPTVQITFTNKLPFGVDLYQVTAEHEEEFLRTLPTDDTYTMTNQNATPIRIREFQSQAEVELYVPGTAPVQMLDIQLKAPHSSLTTKVEIINLSVFNIEVFAFDENGNYKKLVGIDPRMSENVSDVVVGQPFFIREKKSQKVMGYFVSTVNPVRYEFSGINLRSVVSEQTNRVTFQNASKLPVDVYWMNYNGEEELKGHMEPQTDILQKVIFNEARIGHIYAFRETSSNILLDEVIISSSSDYQTRDITARIISPTTRNADQLWSGEVALFTEPNYQGKVYIFHNDAYRYLKQEIGAPIKSIKLGPGTALTGFTDVTFLGNHDVFYLDTPDLTETDIQYNMSSFRISTITPELTSGISAISRLTEEPVLTPNAGKKEISYRTVYRTTITFPATVSAVDIFSTEETTFEAGGKTYTVDPVKHARIHVNSAKQLVLTSPATKLREAILMLRTDTMLENERFFVFQDIDLHKKLANLETGTLAKNKQLLGIKPNYTDDQIQGVQTAIQNLAKAMPAVHGTKAIGQTKDLYTAPDGMTYRTWEINFTNGETAGNNQAVFRTLSAEEIEAATRLDAVDIPRRNLDTELGQLGVWDFAKKVTSIVFQPVIQAAKNVAGVTSDVAQKSVSAVVDTAEGVVDVASDIAQKGASAVAGAANDVAGVTSDIAQKGASAVADTAKDVAGVTSDIAKKGVAAVASTVKDTAQVVATTGVAAINMLKSGAEEVGEFASDTASAALNLPSQAIDLADDVVEDIMSVGETVLKATLDLGDEIIEFTIDTVDKLADCIELIIEKVVDTVDEIIDYLKDLFNWQDILDTHGLMVRYFNSTLDLLRQRVIPDMEVKIDNLLSSIEDKIIGYLDEMIDDFGAGANATESDGKSVGDEVMDKLHWFMDKIFGDEASDSTSTSNGDSGLGTAEEQEGILSVLEELKNKLAGLLDQYGAKIIDTFIDGIETMASAVTAGKDAGKRLIGGLLTIAKALMQTGFAIVKALIAILLKLFKAVITLFQQACNAKIDIPFISDLYKTATNSDLTILSIASLLIAAPTTIICKIAFGKPPKEMIAPAANSLSIEWAQFLSIAYGTTHLALGILETMNDIANVRKEVDVPGLKSKKPQQVNVQNGANVTSNTAGQNAVIQNVRVNINTTYGPPPPPPSTAATPTKTPWMSASDPSHLLPVLVMILGIFTQGFGLPVKGMSHNSGNSGSDPNKTKGDTEPIESASGNTERASNTMNSDSSNLGSATNATDSNASNSGSATNPPNNDPNTPITAPENSAVSDESRILNFSFDNFKDGVASSVWIYQWLYAFIGAADWAFDKWGSDGVKKISGPGAKYLTTGLGVVHLGLQGWQIVLDVLATPDGGAEKTKLAFRSLASAVSVAPNIGKVLFLSNINLACKGIPVLVGTGCNSLGHLIEGSIFIARGIYKDV